ncbi:DNA invertase Pin-like site-specific DNA recombinase [Pseudomonas oryzihabitans]
MFIRADLRVSTDEQDATRAREALRTFAAEHETRVASPFTVSASSSS